MKQCFFMTLILLFSPYLVAQQESSASYNRGAGEVSTRLEEKVKKAVVPISKSLAYLLTTTLPSADGKPRPLGIRIEPTNPSNPDEPIQAIVFHCAFDQATCEPFFRACASLQLRCTGGGGPTP